jgi:hypothetical protein
MDFRSQAERDRDRFAILRADRRKWLWFAPKLRAASNIVAVVWAVLFAYAVTVKAEGAVLLAVAAIPVGLLWLAGRIATRFAAYADKHWA